jgi:Arc/MetJ-type ribon-helix-helix transcriptional regulator
MTIHLPTDLEGRVQAAVHSGRFASLDEADGQHGRVRP